MDKAKGYCKWLFADPDEHKNGEMAEDDPDCLGLYHGDPSPVNFLKTRLVEPLKNIDIYDSRTFQLRNSLMIFGKRGAGKKTLVDAFVDNFKQTIGFSLEDFNLQEFVDWVDSTVSKLGTRVENLKENGKTLNPTLIVVEGIDVIPLCNSPVPEGKLRKLLYHVRALGQRGHPIFIVTTCNESPGRQAKEVSWMIDYECYVPPPSEEDRGKIFEFFIDSWWRAIQTKPDLRNISVNLEPEDYELLVSLSGNCAPGDIWRFCQDMFHAVCKPGETVSLDHDLIKLLIKETESGPCILPYDPMKDLEQFASYTTGYEGRSKEVKESASAQAALDKKAERTQEPEQQWPPSRSVHQKHIPWIKEANAEHHQQIRKKEEEEEDHMVIDDDDAEEETPQRQKRRATSDNGKEEEISVYEERSLSSESKKRKMSK